MQPRPIITYRRNNQVAPIKRFVSGLRECRKAVVGGVVGVFDRQQPSTLGVEDKQEAVQQNQRVGMNLVERWIGSVKTVAREIEKTADEQA